MTYVGRFAPSPTGPLHFGSLLAALASFLDARKHQGQWLLRIEDLDPPREQPGLKDQFPEVLDAFGLYWDGELTYQSERLDEYRAVMQTLLQEQHAYACNCSRKQISERSGSSRYDGHCRQLGLIPDLTFTLTPEQQMAIRVLCNNHPIVFDDLIQGPQTQDLLQESGDFVIFRRDGFFAYQLAVVVDDYLQGITHIVRGSDLLHETTRQIFLQQQLGYPTPSYAHIPVATNAAGQKLSKQTFAQALDLKATEATLLQALGFLGQQPPPQLQNASRDGIIAWAIEHWDMTNIPAQAKQLFAGAY